MADLQTGKINYSPANNVSTMNNVQALPLAVGAGVLGAGVGAIGGAIKKVNIVSKDGATNDTFVKKVYDKYIKNTTDTELQTFEKKRFEITQKLKNVKNKDGLKKFISDNKEIMDKILAPFDQTAESFSESIHWFSSLDKKKQKIADSVKNMQESYFNDVSDKILECWNSTTKKFEKTSGVPDELYKIIKKTKNGIKAKQVAKTAGKTGLIACVGTFVLAKLLGLIQKKQANKQQIVA